MSDIFDVPAVPDPPPTVLTDGFSPIFKDGKIATDAACCCPPPPHSSPGRSCGACSDNGGNNAPYQVKLSVPEFAGRAAFTRDVSGDFVLTFKNPGLLADNGEGCCEYFYSIPPRRFDNLCYPGVWWAYFCRGGGGVQIGAQLLGSLSDGTSASLGIWTSDILPPPPSLDCRAVVDVQLFGGTGDPGCYPGGNDPTTITLTALGPLNP